MTSVPFGAPRGAGVQVKNAPTSAWPNGIAAAGPESSCSISRGERSRGGHGEDAQVLASLFSTILYTPPRSSGGGPAAMPQSRGTGTCVAGRIVAELV